MKQFTGNTNVMGGFYFNQKSWEITVVSGKKGILPGDATQSFVRVPVPVLLVGAPLLGGLYVMFLPFIGFAMLFEALGLKAAAASKRMVAHTAETVSPTWRPGKAYFAGKGSDKAKAAAGKVETEDGLEDLLKTAEKKARKGETKKS